jgi:anti-sigma factor RsiW
MIDEELTRRYLLGQLPIEENQKFENDYFADPTAFEEVVAVENDLIDSYARLELTGLEKRQFEQRYSSSPEGQSRVEFAMALGEIVRSHQRDFKSKKPTFWEWLRLSFRFGAPSLQWALGTACVILCVAVSLLTFKNRELNREVQDARNSEARMRTQRDEAVGQIASLSGHPSDESARSQAQSGIPDLTFTPVAGIERGESHNAVLVVPRDRPWIRLEMPIDEDLFKTYEAVLYTIEMRKVRRGENLKSRSTATGIKVDWRIPSDSIQNGDYVLQLNGKEGGQASEHLNAYSFRVVRK